MFLWRYDTQHNDIQYNDIRYNDIRYNDTQHNIEIVETPSMTAFGIMAFNSGILYVLFHKRAHDAESRYAECRYAECHDAISVSVKDKVKYPDSQFLLLSTE